MGLVQANGILLMLYVRGPEEKTPHAPSPRATSPSAMPFSMSSSLCATCFSSAFAGVSLPPFFAALASLLACFLSRFACFSASVRGFLIEMFSMTRAARMPRP